MPLEHLWIDPKLFLQDYLNRRLSHNNIEWLNRQLATFNFDSQYNIHHFNAAARDSNLTAALTAIAQNVRGNEAPFADDTKRNAFLDQVDDFTLRRLVRQDVFDFADDLIDFTLTRDEFLLPNFIYSEDCKATAPDDEARDQVKNYFVAMLGGLANATGNQALQHSNQRKFAAFTRAINSPSYGFTAAQKLELLSVVISQANILYDAGVDNDNFFAAFQELIPYVSTDALLRDVSIFFAVDNALHGHKNQFNQLITDNVIKLLSNGVSANMLANDCGLFESLHDADGFADAMDFKQQLTHIICQNLSTLQPDLQTQTLVTLFENNNYLGEPEYQQEFRRAVKNQLVTLAKNGLSFTEIESLSSDDPMSIFVEAANAATTTADILALQAALTDVAGHNDFDNAVKGCLDALLDAVDSNNTLTDIATCMRQANASNTLLQTKLEVPSVFVKLFNAGLTFQEIASVHDKDNGVNILKTKMISYSGLLAYLDAGLSLPQLVDIANHNKPADAEAYTRESLRDDLFAGIPDDARIEDYEKIYDFVTVNTAGNIMGVSDDADLKAFKALFSRPAPAMPFAAAPAPAANKRIEKMLNAVSNEDEFTRTINLLAQCGNDAKALLEQAVQDTKLVCELVLKNISFAALATAFGQDRHGNPSKKADDLESEIYTKIGEDYLKEAADLVKLQRVTLAAGHIEEFRQKLAENFPDKILKLDEIDSASKLQALIDLVHPLNADGVTRSIGNASDPLKTKIANSLENTETFAKVFAHDDITIEKIGELLTGQAGYHQHAEVSKPYLKALQSKIADYILSIKSENGGWKHTKPGDAEQSDTNLSDIKAQLQKLREESERYNEGKQSLTSSESLTEGIRKTCRGSMALMQAIDASNYQKLVKIYGKNGVREFTRLDPAADIKTGKVLDGLEADLNAANNNDDLQKLLEKVKQEPTDRSSQLLRRNQAVDALRTSLLKPATLLRLLNAGVEPQEIVGFYNNLPARQGAGTVAINNIIDSLKSFMHSDFDQLTQVMTAVDKYDDLTTATFTEYFDQHFVEWVGQSPSAAEAKYSEWRDIPGFTAILQKDNLGDELHRRRQLLLIAGKEKDYVTHFNQHYRATLTDAARDECKKEVYGDDITAPANYGRLPDFFIHSQDFSVDSIADLFKLSAEEKTQLAAKLDHYISEKLNDITPDSAKILAALLSNANINDASKSLIKDAFALEATVKAWLSQPDIEVEMLRSLGVSDAVITSVVINAEGGSNLAGKKQSILAKTKTLEEQAVQARRFLKNFSKAKDVVNEFTAVFKQKGLKISHALFRQVVANAYRNILAHPELMQANGEPSTHSTCEQQILDLYKQEIARFTSAVETLNASMLPREIMQDYDAALVEMNKATRVIKKLEREANSKLNFSGIMRVAGHVQQRANELKGDKTESSRKSLLQLKAALDQLDGLDFAKQYAAEQKEIVNMQEECSTHIANISSLVGMSLDEHAKVVINDLTNADERLISVLDKLALWKHSPLMLFDSEILMTALKAKHVDQKNISYILGKLAAIRTRFFDAMRADIIAGLKSKGVTGKPVIYYDAAHEKKLNAIAEAALSQHQSLTRTLSNLRLSASIKFDEAKRKEYLDEVKADIDTMLTERPEDAVRGKRAVIFAGKAPGELDYASVNSMLNTSDDNVALGVTSQQYETISAANPDEIENTQQIVKLGDEAALVVSVEKVEKGRKVSIHRDSLLQLDSKTGTLKQALLDKLPNYREKEFANSALKVGRALALSYMSAVPKSNPYYFSSNTKTINITGQFDIKHGKIGTDNAGLLELAVMKVCLTELTKQGYTVDRSTPAYKRYERALSTNSGYLIKNTALTQGIENMKSGADTEHVLPAEHGTCRGESQHDDLFAQEISRRIGHSS